jgi:tRNA(Ile)-lysidine synthase
VHELHQSVVGFIRKYELLHAGDRVAVAVSGGADSVALLRLLFDLRKELGIVLSVAHFNHRLRGAESDADEEFAGVLAKRLKLEFHLGSGDVKTYAAEKHLSIEAAARRLRYEFFDQLLEKKSVDRIATGHTLDDQAETVLLRLARGAGTRGLAGIYPGRRASGIRLQEDRPPSIVRPLLGTRRKDLEAYLESLNQPWREDGSNRDLRFARNRVRHGILPRLERTLNPAVREALAETAEIARAEEEYWQELLAVTLPRVCTVSRGEQGAGVTLSSTSLELPLALRRRVVRAVSESMGLNLEFKHVEEILAVTDGTASGAALPHGWQAFRRGSGTWIMNRLPEAAEDYEYVLPVPGKVVIPEAGITLEAALVPTLTGYNPQHCLDSSVLAGPLRVRNWRSGDRFWPAHTKGPKKIKELLQERRVLGVEKKLWPVVTSGDEIVWLRGFAVPAQFGPRESTADAVMIREIPAEERATK